METNNWKLARLTGCLLAIQTVACITLVLDIPIARQVIGFLFLTFIPGFILLKVSGFGKSTVTETILFSVGLSISFLMFIGLLTNELGLLIGITKPLSTESLAIIINISVLSMSILFGITNKEYINIIGLKGLRVLPRMLPYFVLPLLSVIGAMLVTAYGNNLLLLFLIVIVSVLLLLSPFLLQSEFHSLALISIGSALLFHISLISIYIWGYDINLEYYVFRIINYNSYWNRNLFLFFDQYMYNSMLSVTILPTMFSNLLNIEETWIFKIIYPLIFSLVPLGLYQLYQMQWGKKVAFISVLFFMSNGAFLELLWNAKQMIATLFYILLFLVLLKKDISHESRWINIVCLGFGLINAHYSTNYMFLILIFSTWFFGKILLGKSNLKINFKIIVFLFTFTFLWYVYVVGGPFDRIILFTNKVLNSFFIEFFHAESRGGEVLAALGIEQPLSFLHQIGRILFDITIFLFLVGYITLIARRNRKPMNLEYLLLTSENIVILLMCIIIPYFAGIGMTRMYFFILVFISPLFILGGETIVSALNPKREKKKKSYCSILILVVLMTFFLFQSGFIYEITGDPYPTSISLSKYKLENYSIEFVNENDVFGALWLSKHADMEHTETYSDVVSRYHVLTSYTDLNRDSIQVLSNNTILTDKSYIYLRRFNVISKIIVYNTKNYMQFNLAEIAVFNNTIVKGRSIYNNKLYSNGACEIYYFNY